MREVFLLVILGPDIPTVMGRGVGTVLTRSPDSATYRCDHHKITFSTCYYYTFFTIFPSVACSDIVLEDNAALTAHLSVKALPTKQYFQFMTTDGFGKMRLMLSGL